MDAATHALPPTSLSHKETQVVIWGMLLPVFMSSLDQTILASALPTIGKKSIKHIHFDPRMSPNVLRAFENAEDEVLMNTLKGAPRLDVPSLFRPQFMADVQKEHPEYFADLPALK